jgi:hypothetical protein
VFRPAAAATRAGVLAVEIGTSLADETSTQAGASEGDTSDARSHGYSPFFNIDALGVRVRNDYCVESYGAIYNGYLRPCCGLVPHLLIYPLR